MIRQSEISENSIEELFCIPFSKMNVHPLTKEESSIMMSLLFAELEKKKQSDFKELKVDPFAFPHQNYTILVKSLESKRFDFKISQDAAIMISIMCRVVGDVIMYMAYLHYYYFKNLKDTSNIIDMDELSTRVFPNGFPSKTSLERMWELQKVYVEDNTSSDNLLDYKKALGSLIDTNQLKES